MARERICTCVDPAAAEVLERAAEAERSTVSHIARRLIEDGARSLDQRQHAVSASPSSGHGAGA